MHLTTDVNKRITPPPEPPELRMKSGCALSLMFVSGALTGIVASTGSWWLLVFDLPALLVALYWLQGKLLLLQAKRLYGPRGIAGVLVTSDSPTWNAYIQETWIAPFGDRFVLLNWSRRKTWEHTLPSKLFKRFCGYRENFCPAIIFFQGLRYPLVFRFHHAFRDHKHGNEGALRRLETRLFKELAVK